MSNKAAPPKRESNLELNTMIDAKVHVKCLGGREIVGTLKGYDELVNLVLDDADEYLRGKIIVLSNHKFLLYIYIMLSAHVSHISCIVIFYYIVDPEDADKITDQKRKLGLVVVRGTQVSLVSPEEGREEIANPFMADDEE